MYHPKEETHTHTHTHKKQKIHQSKIELQERINKKERERERERAITFLEENVRQITKLYKRKCIVVNVKLSKSCYVI